MSTFLFNEYVFGPIKSRRLGSSLGLNLLSTTEKVCNYDCIYCECGNTYSLKNGKTAFVDKALFLYQLEERLKTCIENNTPVDTITFAGNGEPTLHPHFLSITLKVVEYRNQYFPNAKIAVLTNGMALSKIRVQKSLKKIDKAIIKLDAGTNQGMQLIDQPKGSYSIDKLVNNIKQFDGEVIIQTMFLSGVVNGKSFDNSSKQEVKAWLELLKDINPTEVMLYSIDRDTPTDGLQKINREKLQLIAKEVEALNIKTQVV